MKRVKTLVVGLVLTLAGVVYAAGGSAQSTLQACDMNKDAASCCTEGASCCTGGGSCCAARTAKQ
jgi:hypothetical protein